MAVSTKKGNKKIKQGLNTKKVIVNNSKVASPPISVGTIVSDSSDTTSSEDTSADVTKTNDDTRDFEQFYNKALQQYLIYKETGITKQKKDSCVVKVTKCVFKSAYKISVTILLVYLLKLYIVYQMRTYINISNVVPGGVVKSYNSVRLFILETFQHLISFLQTNLGLFEKLKLKNEKNLFVDNLVTGLRDASYKSNLESVSLGIRLVSVIIADYLKHYIPQSILKYFLIVHSSIKEHLKIFNQRVFVELLSLWKQTHSQSYEFSVHVLNVIICKIKCIINCTLEELKKLLF